MANGFQWISSGGGPLICVEAAYATSWGGIERLSVPKPGAATDYDRACDGHRKWVTSAPLAAGAALFFQGPFDTSFWRRPRDGKLFVVRIEACEIHTDFGAVMNNVSERLPDHPIETVHFDFRSGDLIIFDSAEEGTEENKEKALQNISPGKYNINTFYIEDTEYSILIHCFNEK